MIPTGWCLEQCAYTYQNKVFACEGNVSFVFVVAERAEKRWYDGQDAQSYFNRRHDNVGCQSSVSAADTHCIQHRAASHLVHSTVIMITTFIIVTEWLWVYILSDKTTRWGSLSGSRVVQGSADEPTLTALLLICVISGPSGLTYLPYKIVKTTVYTSRL